MDSTKKKNHIAGGFLALPKAMLNAPKFRALSGSAVKLLIDIASQYNGRNNGDLSAAWKVMKPKGWKSESTLNRAKKELLEAGFIAESPKGRLPNVCSLYGITWRPLDANAKLDVGPAGFPFGAWAELPRISLRKNTSLTTDSVAGSAGIATESVVEYLPLAIEPVAIRQKRAVS